MDAGDINFVASSPYGAVPLQEAIARLRPQYSIVSAKINLPVGIPPAVVEPPGA